MFLSLLGWVMGSALQLWQADLYPVWVYGLIMAIAGVFIAFLAIISIAKKTGRVDLPRRAASWHVAASGALFLACTALAFGLTGWRATEFSAQTLSPALEGRDVQVVGIVAAMPQESEAGLRFRLEVESAHALTDPTSGELAARVKLPPLIDLSWYGGVFNSANSANNGMSGQLFELQRPPAHLLPGERWQMTVRLKAPHGNSNPGGFDYELYLWEQGVQATGYVRAGTRDTPPIRLGGTWQHPVERLRLRVRDAIFATLASSAPSDASGTGDPKSQNRDAGVVAALVTGDQHAIERADWDVFRATGVAHLMSISGLHITMFAWVSALLAGWLWRRSERLCLLCPAPQVALIGGILLATLYAVFSGWGVPSQRTIWMLATVSLLRLMGKRWPWPTVWLLACAVVVVFDPWALLQAGFWLSFVAVGVLFATDVSHQAAPTRPAQPRRGMKNSVAGLGHRFRAGLWQSTREQWVITAALSPLTLLLFGQVSVVGLLANAVAIPWVTLVVTPLSMLGTLHAPLWRLAAWTMHLLSAYLGYLAKLPFATVAIATPALFISAAGVIGGLFLVMPWPWRLRALGLPLLLPVILWQAPRPEAGQFELLAADIGQGNAVIVRTQTHTLVYDAGPRFSMESDAGHRVLVPLLRSLGEKVDTVMLSHRDIDHSGGVKSVLAMHPGASFISSIEDGHDLQKLHPATRCVAGQQWQWDGVNFVVLHPSAQDYESTKKSNAMSCVLRISTHQNSAMLVGDIELAQEAGLVADQLASGIVLQSDVLLVPHHGSKTSSSGAFLDAVQPGLAIVQAGYRNRFAHPAPVVMQRYQARKIQTIDSAHCGAASWSSVQPGQISCQRQQARRYWQHQVP
ncbi:MAG: DNA internalization-related competence protein ComEC/Rec2 [Burkholderiaceae bacterium]|nr:DNA internalization-related competence protein ComEC/Rec2 [Burkholderiaceae bacterium]